MYENKVLEYAMPVFNLLENDSNCTSKAKYISLLQEYTEKTSNENISQEEITNAKYALCALIDEKMLKNNDTKETWMQEPLQLINFGELNAGENFFLKLEVFMNSPIKYINILELYFFCLSFDFKGVNMIDDNLSALQNNLYRKIKYVREENNCLLHIDNTNLSCAEEKTISIKTITLVTMGLILTVYLGFLIYGLRL